MPGCERSLSSKDKYISFLPWQHHWECSCVDGRGGNKKTREKEIHYVAQWLCPGHGLWDKKSGQEEEKQGGGRQRAAERKNKPTAVRQRFGFGVISRTRFSEGHHPSTDAEMQTPREAPSYLSRPEFWALWNAIRLHPAPRRSPTLNSYYLSNGMVEYFFFFLWAKGLVVLSPPLGNVFGSPLWRGGWVRPILEVVSAGREPGNESLIIQHLNKASPEQLLEIIATDFMHGELNFILIYLSLCYFLPQSHKPSTAATGSFK